MILRILNLCENSDSALEPQRLLSINNMFLDLNFDTFNVVRRKSWLFSTLSNQGFFVEDWDFPKGFSPRAHLKLRNFIFDMNVQAVVVHGLSTLPSVKKWLERLPKIKIFITTDQNHSNIAIPKFARWLVFSDEQKSNLVTKHHLNQHQLLTLPNPVDRRVFNPRHRVAKSREQIGLNQNDFAMGQTSPATRYELINLINLLERVRKTYLNVVLVLPQPQAPQVSLQERKEILSTVAQKKLTPFIKWLAPGFSEPKVINNLDLYIQTLPRDFFNFDVLKPMAAGVPVLALTRLKTHEILKDGQLGWLSPQENIEALYTNTMQIIDNPKLRAEKALNAEKEVERKFERSLILKKLSHWLYE